jgi:ABC-type sugar transport system ATPase subunit
MNRSAIPLVELRGVSRTYAGGVHALCRVDLTISSGQLVAVVGPCPFRLSPTEAFGAVRSYS